MVDKKGQKKYMSRRKGYLSCPLCDLDVKAKKSLYVHFLYLHVRIKRSDAVKDKNGKYFYPCTVCDYQSYVKDDVPEDQSSKNPYNARIRLIECAYLSYSRRRI
jgi:uncharacterized C2H2 Zn-finger protein